MLPDYFTEMYQAVYQALYRRLVVADALVLPGNFPDMSNPNFGTFKNTIKPADVPEIIMIQGSFSLKPFGSNSSIANFSQSFPIVITDPEGLSIAPINPLKLSIMVAAFQAGTSIGPGQYQDNFGLPFIQSFDISDSKDDGISASLFKRGVLRYITLLNITLNGYIDRAALASV